MDGIVRSERKKRGCCIVNSEGQLIQYKTFLVLDPESKQFQYQTKFQ